MKRYPIVQPIDPRPTGTGAFWDYACASARHQDALEAAHPKPSVKLARITAEREQAEARWDAEGGKNGAPAFAGATSSDFR